MQKVDINPSKLVLRVLARYEKEAYPGTKMENNLRLFAKLRIYLKLINGSVNSSFDRSKMYLST